MATEDAERQSSVAQSEGPEDTELQTGGSAAAGEPPETQRPRHNRWSPLQAGLVVGLATVAVLAAICGWLGYRIQVASQAEELRNLLVQAGRQAAINLTTIDHDHADADVRRILDSVTGPFREDFQARSGPFIDAVKKAQSVSVGTVTEAGLESIAGDEGQVLVAVTVKTRNGPGAEQPRYWRMRLTVDRQGGEAKVSKVDFVA